MRLGPELHEMPIVHRNAGMLLIGALSGWIDPDHANNRILVDAHDVSYGLREESALPPGESFGCLFERRAGLLHTVSKSSAAEFVADLL
jgi:hypothetical protein